MVNFNLNKTKSILFLEQISRNASNSRQILQNLVKGFRSLSSERGGFYRLPIVFAE